LLDEGARESAAYMMGWSFPTEFDEEIGAGDAALVFPGAR
jgi:hypothetical protein